LVFAIPLCFYYHPKQFQHNFILHGIVNEIQDLSLESLMMVMRVMMMMMMMIMMMLMMVMISAYYRST